MHDKHVHVQSMMHLDVLARVRTALLNYPTIL